MALHRSKCFSCGSSNLRLAHPRVMLYDMVWLALLRLPVRCRYCRERFYLNIVSAIKLRSWFTATNGSLRAGGMEAYRKSRLKR
jgi:uncharacterized Zn-finger protein